MTTKEEIKQKQMDNLTTTEKLVTSLIDYGYLQREIGELMIYSEDENAAILEFSRSELSIIAKNIDALRKRIKELENESDPF
jgi:phage host-nuclease inhibitor protein Gam